MTFEPNDRVQIVTKRTIQRRRCKHNRIDCILDNMFQYCGQQGTILSIHKSYLSTSAYALVRIDNCEVNWLWPIWALKKVNK